MFADQSGFYLFLPSVVRTYYAPVGQTPVLHEHISPATISRR